MFLDWDIFQTPENETCPVNLGGRIFSNQPGETPAHELINSVSFNYSIISPLPLVSKLLIGPTSSSVNGTEVICTDIVTSSSSSAIVFVIEHLIQGGYMYNKSLIIKSKLIL